MLAPLAESARLRVLGLLLCWTGRSRRGVFVFCDVAFWLGVTCLLPILIEGVFCLLGTLEDGVLDEG
jgi:hypothetical protein